MIQSLDPNNNKDVSGCETPGQLQSVAHQLQQLQQLQQVPDLQHYGMTAGGLASPVTPSSSSQQHTMDTSRLLDDAANTAAAAKLMATPPAYGNPVNPFGANPFLPLGLGLYNQVTPGCWPAPGLVNPLAGLLPWLSASYGLPPVTAPKMTAMSPAWTPPPVVASPINGGGVKDNASDTSLSDMSDLSPMPKHHGSSDCFLKESPVMLLDGVALTEEESIAVSVLTELAMQRR